MQVLSCQPKRFTAAFAEDRLLLVFFLLFFRVFVAFVQIGLRDFDYREQLALFFGRRGEDFDEVEEFRVFLAEVVVFEQGYFFELGSRAFTFAFGV